MKTSMLKSSKPFSINSTAPAISAALEPAFYKALQALKKYLAPTARLHTDSRAIQAGDAFLAYTADKTDQQSYIREALNRGASLVLWESAEDNASRDNDPITYSDIVQPIIGLSDLAGPLSSAWYDHPSANLFLIGITGTNGKTSCSHWIAQALCKLHLPCGIIGTLGSGSLDHLHTTGFTTPNAPQFQYQLAQLRDDKLCAVALEASSHALHLGRLNGTALDVAIFTNLSQDHLDYHGTLQAYAATKARLIEWPHLGCAIINRDDPLGANLLARPLDARRVIAYGIHTEAAQHSSLGASDSVDWPTYAATCEAKPSTTLAALPASSFTNRHTEFVYASKLRATSQGTAFEVHSSWGKGEVEIAALGTFNVSNTLAVFASLIAANIPFKHALAQLSKLIPVAGRMQKVGGNLQANEPLIVIDYAHTPDALEKALTVLRTVTQQRGGQLACMMGCGGDRDTQKRPLMGKIAEKLADKVVLTTDNPRSETPAAIIDAIAQGMDHPEHAKRIEDRAVAILQTIRQAQAQDVIVLAGKGHESTQEIQGKKLPFSDHDHARLALAARGKKGIVPPPSDSKHPALSQTTPLREMPQGAAAKTFQNTVLHTAHAEGTPISECIGHRKRGK